MSEWPSARTAAVRPTRVNDHRLRVSWAVAVALADALCAPPLRSHAARFQLRAQLLQSDLHFFLGTTQQFHFVAPNPWVIIGVLPIPHEPQQDLFG
jgi:hypothetical protein